MEPISCNLAPLCRTISSALGQSTRGTSTALLASGFAAAMVGLSILPTCRHFQRQPHTRRPRCHQQTQRRRPQGRRPGGGTCAFWRKSSGVPARLLLIARGADTAAAGIKANPMVAIAALLNKLRRPIAVIGSLPRKSCGHHPTTGRSLTTSNAVVLGCESHENARRPNRHLRGMLRCLAVPRNSVTTFVDPSAFQEAVRSAQVEVLVTAQGDFRAELTHIELHKLSIQRGRETLPRVGRGAMNAEQTAIYFLIGPDQPVGHHCGVELSPGEIVINAAVSTYHHVTSALCHWGDVSLTPDDLAAAGRALAGVISYHPIYHKS
jgi:hypothetical protein